MGYVCFPNRSACLFSSQYTWRAQERNIDKYLSTIEWRLNIIIALTFLDHHHIIHVHFCMMFHILVSSFNIVWLLSGWNSWPSTIMACDIIRHFLIHWRQLAKYYLSPSCSVRDMFDSMHLSYWHIVLVKSTAQQPPQLCGFFLNSHMSFHQWSTWLTCCCVKYWPCILSKMHISENLCVRWCVLLGMVARNNNLSFSCGV